MEVSSLLALRKSYPMLTTEGRAREVSFLFQLRKLEPTVFTLDSSTEASPLLR